MTYEFNVTTSLVKADKLKQEWDLLLDSVDGAFFQDWRWYQPLNLHLIPNIQFITAKCKKKLILVFPIVIEPDNRRLLLPYCKQTDLIDCLLDPDVELPSLAQALSHFLHSTYEGWNTLENHRMLENSHCDRLFKHLPMSQHLDPYASNTFFTTESPDQIDALSKKHIKNVKRYERKLSNEIAPPSYRIDNSDQALEEFLAIENSGWKGERGKQTSILSDPKLTAFYKQVRKNFDASGKLVIEQCWIDERLIASKFTLRNQNTQYLLKIAYDDEFQPFSPGNVLLWHMIQRAMASDDQQAVNLVTGPAWADRWHPQSQTVTWATLYSNTLAGRLAYKKQMAKEVLRPIKDKLKANGPAK